MNDNIMLQKLREHIAHLINAPCWGVSGSGGATGSRFNLHLGGKCKRSRPIDNNNISKILQHYRGEMVVHVSCAAWRLEDQDRPITSSADQDNQIKNGLASLENSIVTRADILPPGMDLVIEFDNGKYLLKIFCDQFIAPYDNYFVGIRNDYICVNAKSEIVIEQNK
jgi:hypothetical protein